MIRPLTIFSVLILLMYESPAQESKISFGTGLGLNITNVTGTADLPGKDDVKSFNLTGIRFYTLLGYKFNKHLVMLIEPGYEQKGYKLDTALVLDTAGGQLAVSGDLLFLTNYFSIPATLNFTAGNKIRLNAGAGAYIGFLVNSKLRVETDQGGFSVDDLDYSSNFNSLDYGVLARASVELKLLSFLALEVGASYSLGLAKLNTDEYFTEASLKHKAIYAGAGIRLYLAGKGSEGK